MSAPVSIFRNPNMPVDQGHLENSFNRICKKLTHITYKRKAYREDVELLGEADCLTILWNVLAKVENIYAGKKLQLPELVRIGDMPQKTKDETDWYDTTVSIDELKAGDLIYLGSRKRAVSHIVLVISPRLVFHCSIQNKGTRFEEISKVFARYVYYEDSSTLLSNREIRSPFELGVPYEQRKLAQEKGDSPSRPASQSSLEPNTTSPSATSFVLSGDNRSPSQSEIPYGSEDLSRESATPTSIFEFHFNGSTSSPSCTYSSRSTSSLSYSDSPIIMTAIPPEFDENGPLLPSPLSGFSRLSSQEHRPKPNAHKPTSKELAEAIQLLSQGKPILMRDRSHMELEPSNGSAFKSALPLPTSQIADSDSALKTWLDKAPTSQSSNSPIESSSEEISGSSEDGYTTPTSTGRDSPPSVGTSASSSCGSGSSISSHSKSGRNSSLTADRSAPSSGGSSIYYRPPTPRRKPDANSDPTISGRELLKQRSKLLFSKFSESSKHNMGNLAQLHSLMPKQLNLATSTSPHFERAISG